MRKKVTPKSICKCQIVPRGDRFPEGRYPWEVDIGLPTSNAHGLARPVHWSVCSWLLHLCEITACCAPRGPRADKGSISRWVWLLVLPLESAWAWRERSAGHSHGCQLCDLLTPGAAPPPRWSFFLIFEIWSLQVDLQWWPAARNKSHIKTIVLF